MAKKDVITAAPTPPALTLDAAEVELILAYRAMDGRSKQHILGLSKRLAERCPNLKRPSLRLIAGSAE